MFSYKICVDSIYKTNNNFVLSKKWWHVVIAIAWKWKIPYENQKTANSIM